MSPDLSQEARETMTMEEYEQLKADLAQAVVDREEALAAKKRKKRQGERFDVHKNVIYLVHY